MTVCPLLAQFMIVAVASQHQFMEASNANGALYDFMSCLASANIKHRLHCQEQYLCNAKIFISILLQMGFNCWNVLGDWVSLSSFHKSVTTVTGEKRRFQQDRHFTGWALCWLDTFYIIFCSPHRHRKGRQGRGGWPRLKLINVFKNVS